MAVKKWSKWCQSEPGGGVKGSVGSNAKNDSDDEEGKGLERED